MWNEKTTTEKYSLFSWNTSKIPTLLTISLVDLLKSFSKLNIHPRIVWDEVNRFQLEF